MSGRWCDVALGINHAEHEGHEDGIRRSAGLCKDALAPGIGFDFLGYHFEAGTRWPRKKSLKKIKDALRHKTRRSNGHSLATIVVAVNVSLRGWFACFKHSHPWTFVRLDRWLRRRPRSILRKRMHKRGVSRGHDHYRWPNQYFGDHGLISLEVAHRALLQSS